MFKKEKGITLIALIITIIVMLILVGVTINVALNGGLFTKASEASKQMQIEAEKEELLSSVVAAIGYDGKVDLGEIELPTGWTGSNGTYISPKGNTYTVDENGKITEGEKDTKPTLKQIKEGDVWKNVTFSSMKLSNTEIPAESFGFMLDDEEPLFEYQVHEDGSRMLFVMINENKYIYYIFYLGEEIGASFEEMFGYEAEFEKFYLKDDEMGIMKEMTEEDLNNINFSGAISILSDDNYIPIPSQMLAWFTGEVEYAE